MDEQIVTTLIVPIDEITIGYLSNELQIPEEGFKRLVDFYEQEDIWRNGLPLPAYEDLSSACEAARERNRVLRSA